MKKMIVMAALLLTAACAKDSATDATWNKGAINGAGVPCGTNGVCLACVPNGAVKNVYSCTDVADKNKVCKLYQDSNSNDVFSDCF